MVCKMWWEMCPRMCEELRNNAKTERHGIIPLSSVLHVSTSTGNNAATPSESSSDPSTSVSTQTSTSPATSSSSLEFRRGNGNELGGLSKAGAVEMKLEGSPTARAAKEPKTSRSAISPVRAFCKAGEPTLCSPSHLRGVPPFPLTSCRWALLAHFFADLGAGPTVDDGVRPPMSFPVPVPCECERNKGRGWDRPRLTRGDAERW
jgi:hypothetical protein